VYKIAQQLIYELEENAILYCHWKSNQRIISALSGEDDLDLLVSASDWDNFLELLNRLGAIEAENKNIAFSGVYHFYLLDYETFEILHLHVYRKLITGSSWIKEFDLGCEDECLNSRIRHESGIFIAAPSFEYIIFAIRILVKCSTFLEALILFRDFDSIVNEIEYLKQVSNREDVKRFLACCFPVLSVTDIEDFLADVNSRDYFGGLIKARALTFKIRTLRRINYPLAFIKQLSQFVYRSGNKLIFRKKKSFKASGKLIAIVGLDATGKTTITTELKNWLGKYFSTFLIHVGKPPASLLSYIPNFFIKLGRGHASSINRFAIQRSDSQKSLIFCLRQVILAFDRWHLLQKFQMAIDNNEIVICDRFPSLCNGVMDSPRLDPNRLFGIKKILAWLENRFYKKMRAPDLILRLTVPVDIAVKRNRERIKEGKETEDFIRVRHKLNKNLTYRAKTFREIDTTQNLKTVLEEAKKIIWKELK
jgi:thymidylate kinase